MSKNKFKPVKDGQWINPKMRGYIMECCDCGLRHKLDFVVVDSKDENILNGGKVIFRAYRVNHKPKRKKK